jgi:hypothetical protein
MIDATLILAIALFIAGFTGFVSTIALIISDRNNDF